MASTTPSWFGTGERVPSGERLEMFVGDLMRAKTRQALLDCACKGLFCGLLIACAGVPLIRFMELSLAPWRLAAGAVLAALVVSLLVVWVRRPSDLPVVIFADLQLNLQQTLSTAWEFARGGGDPRLTERLAAQAIKARLPSRCDQVFPLELNIWGRLTPVVAVLLVLVSVADLPWRVQPATAAADPVVMREGAELRDYGRRMQDRAELESLPRSEAAARELQQLGDRMESGSLVRRQALSRLRQLAESFDQQRAAALRGASETTIDPDEIESLTVSSPRQRASPQAMLQRLLTGGLDGDDLEALSEQIETLSRHGVSAEQLRQAIDDFEQGDSDQLRELLQDLSRMGQALRDADELQRAREQVTLAREDLGDSEGAAEGGVGQSDESANGMGDGSQQSSGGLLTDGMSGDHDVVTAPRSAGFGLGDAADSTAALQIPESGQSGAIVKPEAPLQDTGQVFASEATLLPRSGQAVTEELHIDPTFTAQLEQVLAKEHYPLHHKEFIRRYFLGLSQSGHGDAER